MGRLPVPMQWFSEWLPLSICTLRRVGVLRCHSPVGD